MKKFNLWASMIALFLCVGFASCGDDDDNNADNAGPGNVIPTDIKKVVSIRNSYETIKFTYANGKLASVEEEDSKYAFAYSGNTVTITCTYSYDPSDKDVYTMNVGSNGFLKDGTAVSTETYNGETYTSTAHVSFSYDKEGHLTAINTNSKDSEGDEYTSKTEFIWENGNITKTIESWREKTEGGEDSGKSTRISTYSKEENTACISFFDEVADLDELEYVYYAGLLGKSTKNLLKSMKSISEDGSENYVTNYSYKLDSDNYPTTVTIDNQDNFYTYK